MCVCVSQIRFQTIRVANFGQAHNSDNLKWFVCGGIKYKYLSISIWRDVICL